MAAFKSSGTVSYSPSITMAVSGIISEIKTRYWSKIAIFFIPVAFDAPVSGVPSEYCYTVWCEKLEWWGYPMVRKVS